MRCYNVTEAQHLAEFESVMPEHERVTSESDSALRRRTSVLQAAGATRCLLAGVVAVLLWLVVGWALRGA